MNPYARALASPSSTPPRGKIAPRTSPAAAASPTSSAAIMPSVRVATTPPAPRFPTASTRNQSPPASNPSPQPRNAPPSRVPIEALLALSEPVDHVELGTPSREVRGDGGADAEEAPEHDLDGRVVEGVEVPHRDEEAESRGEDRPLREREPAIADGPATAVDAGKRRTDHPHDERPADQSRAQQEGEMHVLVVDLLRETVRPAADLDQRDRAL